MKYVNGGYILENRKENIIMIIKKGDKIRLKSNIIKRHYVSEYSIKKLSNKILTVSVVLLDGIKILEDDIGYIWFYDMFDKVYYNDCVDIYIKNLEEELENKKNEIKSIEDNIKAFKFVLDNLKKEETKNE